ncbi:hypothetical protein CVT26_000135 [Gymnopilus dilepis]|uniref:EamA domain-containing protein n=1 Tax=Gymnopilus dilepis TaxID=231916 RepID=A0A409VGZ2_9AGAR|nr:hypothetical protein CVT26_000135 [Gymnopilus dilepis]
MSLSRETDTKDQEDLKVDSRDSSRNDTSTQEKEPLPPIVFSSPSAFVSSFAARWKSIWTRSFILSLLAGQVVSLCITCTNVTTTELVNRGWTLSTTQGFFTYFSLFIIYTPYTMYKYGLKGWGKLVLRDGWRYLILGACDVEGNFLVIRAYQYTDLLSCMLLDAWAIPVCLFFSWLYMGTKYHWTQLLGVFICIGGLGMLVASDEITSKSWEAVAKGKGDAFMIAGATLYGFTNATEEFFVRKRPLYEVRFFVMSFPSSADLARLQVVGQLGMWGLIVNGIQASALEWRDMKQVPWTGEIIGILMAFTAAMFILYTVAPLLYRMASSAYYNLSLLSSDFYGLLFGLFLYHYRPYWLYFISFAVVICGLITYFWHSRPEEQGVNDPKAPEYLAKLRGGPIVDPITDEEQGTIPTLAGRD